MQLQFLGAATTVTGSQFLLTTDRAKILVDCGMFQGSPNESIRNRIPLAYDPATIDAILLTHAHLDHCGLIPYVVAQGYRGPIYATAGTAELARLVLLDSGKLQQEFAKRNQRWERRHPDEAVQEERDEQASFKRAMELADEGAAGIDTTDAVEAQGGREVEDDEADAPLNRSASGASPAAGAGAVVTGPCASAGRCRGADECRRAGAAKLGTSAVIVPDDHLLAADDWPPLDRDSVASGKAWVAPNPEVALRYQPPAVEVDLDEPLYDEQEAERALLQFKAVRYDDEVEVAPGIHATFVDAGHILGSAIIRLRVSEGAPEGSDGQAPERRIVFSGDLGRRDTPIIRDPTVVTDADYVLVESTYGGREHEPQDESIRVLAETVQLVADHDGVLLVPSFAIGRTQEVVWQLDRLLEEGKIPALPLYLDSPMASKASDVYRHHPDYYDAETRRLLEEQDSPLDYPGQIITNDVQQSKAIARARRPYMIVASNGMLTGGRVVAHLRELIDDPRAVLLFVGYQGHGTLGAHLQAGATTVRLDGQIRTVRCQVRSISGFSAHADESELLDWIANFGRGKKPGDEGFPRRVFLVHGDPDAQRALEPKVRALGFPTDIPEVARDGDPGLIGPRPRERQPPGRCAFRAFERWSAAWRAANFSSDPAQPVSTGTAGLIEVDEQGRVVRRHGNALASLAIDVGRADAFRHGPGHEQVVDAHPVVLVEIAGPVVPPRVAAGLRPDGAVGIDEAPFEQRAERLAFARRNVGRAVDRRFVPHVGRRRRHVEVAADDERLVGRRRFAEPPQEPLVPRELARVERRVDDPSIRCVQRDEPDAARHRRQHPRLVERVEVVLVERHRRARTRCCAPARHRSSSRSVRRRTVSRDAIATPFQRPSP